MKAVWWAGLGFIVGLAILPLGIKLGVKLGVKVVLKLITWMSGPTGQSPVRVLGGSTTFRVLGGWQAVDKKCTDGCSYYANTNPFSDNKPPSALDMATFDAFLNTQSYAITKKQWQIDTYPYSYSAGVWSIASSPAVTICSTGNNATCGPGNGVLLVPRSNGFYPAGKDVPPEADSAHKDGKRYRDSSCHVEQGDFCEHLAQVGISVDGNPPTPVPCAAGACMVSIYRDK